MDWSLMPFKVPSPNELPQTARNAIQALKDYVDRENYHAPIATTAERDALPQVAGIWVFNSDIGRFQGFDGTTWHNFH